MTPRKRPSLLSEIAHDVAAAALARFEVLRGRSMPARLWVVWKTYWDAEALPSLIRYRVAAWLRRHRVPLIPRFLETWNRVMCGLSIGPPVVLGPGAYFPHGQVVIDGIVSIGARCVFSPYVTIGLSSKMDDNGEPVLYGPTIGDNVLIGTGAKVLGPVQIGDGARIGANAVVLTDVPAGATAVGVPARVILPSQEPAEPDLALLA